MSGPFKMKGSPMARNYGAPFRDEKPVEGGVLPTAEVSGGTAGKGKTRIDVTKKYKKTGSKETRGAIASGSKVYETNGVTSIVSSQ